MSQAKPLWHGICLVAGGAVGAGMFALPTIAAGAWTTWAIVGLIVVWLFTFQAAFMLTRVNLAMIHSDKFQVDHQCSFSSLVKPSLGKQWERVNNLSIIFIMMILMYAYSTAGGSIVSYGLEKAGLSGSTTSHQWYSVLFAGGVAVVVWLGTSMVSKVVLVLMVAMAVTFVMASIGIIPSMNIPQLWIAESTAPYALNTIPVFVTAFACAGLVPSLVRHYPSKPTHAVNSLFWGTVVALVIYVIWITITFASIGREGFLTVIASGGNINQLTQALADSGVSADVESRLAMFSHCAVITSFFGVAVGFVHFMQDRLGLGPSSINRLKATLVCFLPPVLGSFFYPYGFVQAIGFAGLFVAFSFFFIPGMMAIRVKKITGSDIPLYLAALAIGFGIVVFVLKSLSLASVLPSYGA